MKRDTITSSDNFAAPVTAKGTNFVTTQVISHSLSIVPMFRLYYEPFADGVLYPPLGDRVDGFTTNPRNTSQKGPYILAWPSLTSLTIELGFESNTLTGTFLVYWVIYRDYGLA